MERRRSRRLPIAVNAAVFYRGRRIGPYRMYDISARGARLAPGPIMFQPGCEIEIELPRADIEGDAPPRLTAEVVHASAHGIGLCFQEIDEMAAPLVESLARARSSETT